MTLIVVLLFVAVLMLSFTFSFFGHSEVLNILLKVTEEYCRGPKAHPQKLTDVYYRATLLQI